MLGYFSVDIYVLVLLITLRLINLEYRIGLSFLIAIFMDNTYVKLTTPQQRLDTHLPISSKL